MSVAEDIRAAVAFTGYPCAQNVYKGEAQEYFVFNLTVLPVDFADDEPQHERYLVMLHLYCPPKQDTTELRKNIKLAVQSAGFCYPSEENASDEQRQHIVFEFEDARGV